MMTIMMMVMTLIMKIIFLHFNNHKNVLQILFIKFQIIFFVFDKYKNTIAVFADFRKVNFLLDKTPLGETGCLSNPYFLLTDCLGIQFSDPFPFPNTVS